MCYCFNSAFLEDIVSMLLSSAAKVSVSVISDRTWRQKRRPCIIILNAS